MIGNNRLAKRLAIISGVLLIISGTTGVGAVRFIEQFVSRFLHDFLIQPIFRILLIIASFGGISVLIGAYLIHKRRIIIAKLFIFLGSGAGIIGMAVNFLTMIFSGNLNLGILLSFSTIGVVLALISRTMAK